MKRLAGWLYRHRGRNKKTLVLVPSVARAEQLRQHLNELANGENIAGSLHRGHKPKRTGKNARTGKKKSPDGTITGSLVKHDSPGHDPGQKHSIVIKERDDSEAFREGSIDVLIGVNLVSVGFDVRDITTLVVARAAVAPNYFEQCIGRGSRVFARGTGNRFRLVVTRSSHEKEFAKLYGFKSLTAESDSGKSKPHPRAPGVRTHRDHGNDRRDSHRILVQCRVEFDEAGMALHAFDNWLAELQNRAEVGNSWTVRASSLDYTVNRRGVIAAACRFTSDLLLWENCRDRLDDLHAVIRETHAHPNAGRPKLVVSDLPGLQFSVHPFALLDPDPVDKPTRAQRNELARYLLLLVSYLEPALVTFGTPTQFGTRFPHDQSNGGSGDVRLGRLDAVLPATQALHREGRPLHLEDRREVPDVFDLLRRQGGEARDCSGVDVERLLDGEPTVWVRFPAGALHGSPAQMIDWIDLWREVVREGRRCAETPGRWTLPAIPRRDQLLPTGAPSAYFKRLLPELAPSLRERLVTCARENRLVWEQAGPTPRFWAEMWPER